MAATHAIRVDPSNADQARAWDGDEGEFWAAHADRFEISPARYDERLLDAAAIADTDRVMDIGCGTGSTTRAVARRATSGRALGVDLSSRMIQVARRTAAAEGVLNARFEQADAQVHPFEAGAFDVALSRTGAMFFGDAVAAFTNIARALRPRGRLVLLVWQELANNEWIREIVTALAAGRDLPGPPPGAPGPFSLSDPDRVRAVLAKSGFGQPRIEGLTEPLYFGSDAADAYDFLTGLTGWMLNGLDDDGRGRALAALRASLDAHESATGVEFGSAAWLITAERAG